MIQSTPIKTRPSGEQWECRMVIGQLGEVVIATGRTEWLARIHAARFIDGNYPELVCHFDDFPGWPNTDRGVMDSYWGGEFT